MIITSENYKIIQCLETAKFSIKELAEILNVDNRKIYYSLKNIGEAIGNPKISVEELYEKILENSLAVKKNIRKYQILTPDERKLFLALSFFKDETINQNELSKILEVSRKTISGDIYKIKLELKKFNLEIKSYSSMGIKLEGTEKNKRDYFRCNFLKLLMESNYLPDKILVFYKEFREVVKKYEIDRLLEELLQKEEFSWRTMLFLDFKVMLFISFSRKKFGKQIITEEKNKFYLNLENFIENNTLKLWVETLEEYYEQKNREKLKQTKEFLNYVMEKSGFSLNISERLLMIISSRIRIIEFKNQMEISQFYIFNKNTSKDYMEIFCKLRKIFRDYFNGHIDSFDEVFLFQNIFRNIEKTKSTDIKRQEEILIVYNFFPLDMIKDICKELEEYFSRGTVKYISFNILEKYILNKKIKKVIIFENIDIPNGEYEVVRYHFPMTELEIENLKDS